MVSTPGGRPRRVKKYLLYDEIHVAFRQDRSRVNVAGVLRDDMSWYSAAGPARAEPLQDGPYVLRAADGSWHSKWIEGQSEGPRVRDQTIEIGEVVTVGAVGTFPAFDVKLRGPAQPARDDIPVSTRTPLFVMADTHGEFEIAVQLLQRHGVIDDRLRWSFGKGHLAVLGDVFDRGPNHTELLWLIYKLEAEAARAGGGVHLALGNHEAMVLTGDERYLNPKYPRVAALLGVEKHTSLWNEQSLLGQWLRSKAAVFRLGQYLCLHGGISRELVDRGLTLSAVNQAVRAALTEQTALGRTDRVRHGTRRAVVVSRIFSRRGIEGRLQARRAERHRVDSRTLRCAGDSGRPHHGADRHCFIRRPRHRGASLSASR